MTDLLQEVDDIMRRERLEKFWHDNGNWIIGFIVLVILSTAGYSGYKSWSQHIRTTQTATLIEALENENFAEVAQDITEKFSGELKAAALLTAAGRALETDQKEQALAHYKTIINDKSGSGEFYGLAVIMAARLDTKQDKTTHLPALQTVAGNQTSPWRYHSFLEMALIEANNNQNYTLARTYLKNIIEAPSGTTPIPSSLIERARSLDHVYKLLHSKIPQKQEG